MKEILELILERLEERILMENNFLGYGLCCIATFLEMQKKLSPEEEQKFLRFIREKNKNQKVFFDYNDVTCTSIDQFHWQYNDFMSRKKFLKREIKLLTK